jgi:hypothetical protein
MRDLTDPFLSFADGASTTVEGLSAFLARPDMQERIRELENNIAGRARAVASDALPSAVAAMQLINKAFAREERDHPLDTSSSPQAVERRRRFAETSRRATSLIIRIARVQGGPPRAPRPSQPGAPSPPRRPVDRDECDRALIQELAFNRRVAARILDEILPRPAPSRTPHPREPKVAPTNPATPSQQPSQNTSTESVSPTSPPTRSPSNPPASSPILPLDHSATLPLPSNPPRDFPTPPLLSRIPDPLCPLPLDRFTNLPLLFPPTPASRLIAAAGNAAPRAGPAP